MTVAKLGGSVLHHVTPASAEDHVGPTARGLVGERGPESGGAPATKAQGPYRSKTSRSSMSRVAPPCPCGGIHDLATVSSPTRKWSEVEPATVAGCAVQRSHGRSLEDDAFRNDVARPCAVEPMTARCRFAVAGTPTGYAAAPSGTFAADGHGAPSARSRSPMSATLTPSRARRLAVARARADAGLGPADARGLGSNVMLRPG